MKHLICLLLILCQCPRICATANIRSTFYTINEGLADNQVNHIYQDSKGFIWMSTLNGLSRYDGYSFITFRPEKGVPLSLADRHVVEVFEDPNALLWIKTSPELYSCYNLRRSCFVDFTGSGHHNEKYTNHLLARNGDVWLWHHQNGCRRITFSNNRFTSVIYRKENGKLPGKHILNLVEDTHGNILICTEDGVVKVNGSQSELLPADTKTPTTPQPNTLDTMRSVSDSRGWQWTITHNDGLFLHKPATGETIHHLYREGQTSCINTNQLICLMEDRSGSIWIATHIAGIIKLSVGSTGATYIQPGSHTTSSHETSIRMLARMGGSQSPPPGLTNINLQSHADEEIWMGGPKGEIFKYNTTRMEPGSGTLQPLPPLTSLPPLRHPVYKAIKAPDGKLWLGSRGDGLCIDGQWYHHLPADSTSIGHYRVFDIFHDHRGRGWLATFGGGLDLAIRHDNGQYTFRHYLTGNLSRQEVRVITSDKNNWMWVGTDDGLCVFHPDSLIRNPQHYHQYTYSNNYLLGNEIKAILYDSHDRIWLGTMGGGISLCTPGTNYAHLQFTHYTTAEGLINNMVQSIIEDREGNIWIGTNYGISRFNPTTEQFENFFFDNSISRNVYSEKSALLLDDGRLLFGTANGAVIINPAEIQTTHSIPSVTLTDLKINGISVSPGDEDSPLTRSLNYTETIRLKHLQNSFAIEFSTLDYQNLNGTRYTYKLHGFDKEWSIASPLNFAAYKNLPPGKYALYLKACNAVGTWSEKETVLQIVITPPFWKTTWAYLIYILLLIIAAYIAFKTISRFNTLRNRIQVEKQLTEYKLVFFTNISHEFRTPLTLIQGALEKMTNGCPHGTEMTYAIRIMERSTQRMLRLINQLLEFRKMQNKKLSLSLEETEIISFLRNIYLSFSDTAGKKNMQFSFAPSVDVQHMFIDKEKLDKMVYNLLSNAFKYTPNGGKITFSVIIDHHSGKLLITVSDSGVGIPKEKQSQLFSRFMQSSFSGDSMGIGLHLTHELVNIHKGSITYRENEGGGSVFAISLPLATSVYIETDFLLPNPIITDDLLPKTSVAPSFQVEESPSPPINKNKVLIIEDDTDVREFLENELRPYFEVISEPDGTSGLEQARACGADLIVCDVLMPGLTGYEVTRQLKNDFDTSHIPVILLTAMSRPENQLEGVESGADAYIIKPFSPKLLLARIFQLINQREKLRKKFLNDPGITQALVSSTADKKFLDKLHAILEKNINNPELIAEDIAAKMNLGRTTFFRKVRGVTGSSPNEYIRILRIKKAAELLLDGNYNISEVSYQVGFGHPFYFSKCFKEQFGVPPSVYVKNGGRISEDTEDIAGSSR